jgi:DNA-binding transcriptional LysR family regulator
MPSATRPNDNWDDYRYFLAVARAGTLSAAAERLGTEHTTVARHIHALERALNTRLFHKSHLGYALTDAGERLLATAEAIESALLASRAAAVGEQEIAGIVRIGAPDGFGSMFLAPRIHALTARHPRLEVEIFAAARIFSLTRREADIAIGLSGAEHLRVASRRLTDYRMFVYGTKSYLKRAARIRSKADLVHHPFVGYVEELLFSPELSFSGAVGVEIPARVRSTNLLTQVHATLSGHCLCIIPAYVAAAFPALVPVLPDAVEVTRTFHMHVHEDHWKSAHVRAVASFIVEEVEANTALFLDLAS